MAACFLSSVFKKAVILVYREHYKLKKKMVRIPSHALIPLFPYVTQSRTFLINIPRLLFCV